MAFVGLLLPKRIISPKGFGLAGKTLCKSCHIVESTHSSNRRSVPLVVLKEGKFYDRTNTAYTKKCQENETHSSERPIQAKEQSMPLPNQEMASNSLVKLSTYWIIGAAAGIAFLRPDIQYLTPINLSNPYEALALTFGILTTFLTNYTYSKISHTSNRSLDVLTLTAFPILNGIFESILFILTFKLGVNIITPFNSSSFVQYFTGFMTMSVYSGLIHALFWLKILPPHLKQDPRMKGTKRVWIVGITFMSMMWCWLYHQYGHFWPVVGLHVLFDAGMVWSIRYSMFENANSAAERPL